MKKAYYLGIVMVLFLWGTGTIVSQTMEYALNESFEQGLPVGWTQEHVSGSVDWIAEAGGEFPSGAADGNMRMALRNETDQTQGFVTRLITPVLDLKDMFQPILIFSHAQEHNLGDVDELRVYYRTSASSPWVLYEEDGVFTDRIRTWQSDTIILTAVSKTYQLAFEAKDNFGRGVVLDKVQVRPMPTCTDPIITLVDMATASTFRVNWRASFDSEDYAVKVSASVLDDPETATGDVLLVDTVVDTESLLVENLDVNTTYYAYVKANCPGESSGWTGTSYRTNASVELPHTERFNLPALDGYLDRVDTWTWGNTWEDRGSGTFSPFVNTNTSVGTLYYYSPDSTRTVVFAGANSVTTPVDPGEACWLISPELLVDDIRKVQVSFWGGCWIYYKRYEQEEYASSLIVGVMEDPTEIASFVPIDTVSPSRYKFFDEFIVPFDRYEGAGKYVAFVSAFDQQNLFYLDNVTFDYIPACPKIEKVEVVPFFTSAKVTVDKKGAAQWEIVVTDKAVSNPATVSSPVFKQTNITGDTITVTGLSSMKDYYVYARTLGSGEGGVWSNVVQCWTFPTVELPMMTSFEADEPSVSIQQYNKFWGSSYKLPEVVRPYLFGTGTGPHNQANASYSIPHTGNQSLYIARNLLSDDSPEDGDDAWVALPPVDDVKQVQLTFWMRLYGSSDTYLGTSKLVVGVMDNPADLSTFDTIAVFEAESYEKYEKCQVYFDEYKGDGKFIALWEQEKYTLIDDVELSLLPSCPVASNLQATPLDDGRSVRLDWNGKGAEKFRILIDEFDMTDTLAMENTPYVAMIDTVVENISSLTIDGLELITNYFVTIRSECTDDVSSPWWPPVEFRTSCVPMPLPYEMNFDQYQEEEIGSSVKKVPDCWDTQWASYSAYSSTSYYPYISQSTTTAFSPKNYLNLSGGSGSPRHRDYVVLPEMDADLSELQISFMIQQGNQSYELLVGVLPDETDTTTFVPVDTIRLTSLEHRNKWREVVVSFDGYVDLPQRARIMLRSSKYALEYNYIDDVVVDYIATCNKPDDLKVKNVSSDEATLYWSKGGNETKWDVMVLKAEDVLPEEAKEEDIVLHRVHEGNPEMTITDADGLDINTPYWYYLRAICSENDTTGWTMLPGSFRTGCVPLTADELGVETFETTANNFDCWVVGSAEGDNPLTPNMVSLSGTNNTTRALHMWTSTKSNSPYAIMPEVLVDDISTMEVSFDATRNGDDIPLVVGVITQPGDLTTFVPVDTIVTEFKDYLRYVVRFNRYQGDSYGDKGKNVMFLAYSPEGGEHIYVDNVKVDTIPPCLSPTKVYAENVTHVSADVLWEDTGADSYRVFVSTEPMAEDGTLPENPVYDETRPAGTVSLTNLSPLTTYYMYVQAACGGGDQSDWSFERKFTTTCPPNFALPYEENFDDYDTGGQAMPCWNYFYSSGTSYPSINTSYNNTVDGKASLYLYTGSTSKYYCMALSPEIDTEDMSALRLSFDVLQASAITQYPRLIVGVTQYPDSLTLDSFVPVDTICIPVDQVDPITKVWYAYQYDLTAIAALEGKENYKHVVLAVSRDLNRSSATATTGTSGGLYVDNLKLDFIPTCEPPVDVTAADYTEDSFTLSWKNPGAATQWNVQYGAVGFILGEGITVQADDTVKVLEGLQPNMEYDVYVQAVCAENDASDWTFARGRTIGQPVTIFPYVCGFEDETENAAWWAVNGEATNKWYVGKAIAKDGEGSLYISNDGGVSAVYTVSSTTPHNGSNWMARTLKLDKGEYTVTFDWTCYGNTSSDFMRVGLLPGDVTFEPSVGSTQGKVQNLDGTTTTMSALSGGTPLDWIALEGVDEDGDPLYRLTGVDTTGVDIDWRTNVVRFTIGEEAAGYYNLVFYWRNSSTTSKHPEPSAVVDNVKVEKSSCPVVVDLQMTQIGDTTVSLAWTALDDTQTSWNIKVLDTEWGVDSVSTAPDSVVVKTMEATATTWTIDGLQPYTQYYIYVQGVCGGNWARLDVQTTCSPEEIGYVWTFEEEGGYQTGTSASYIAPDCWMVGNKKSTSYTYIPYKIKNTNSYTYSMSNGKDENHALKLYSTTTNNGSYAIMPAFDGNPDTLQLRFYARAGHASATYTPSEGGYKISTTNSSSTYARSIIVGTVTDPYDISTFQALDTLQMRTLTTSMYANADNNWLFDEFTVSLENAQGRYVTFLSEFDKNNYAYIDNVTIESLSGCVRPSDVSVDMVYADGADVSWASRGEATQWIVKVATDVAMENVVYTDTVTETNHRIIGLQSGTLYYVGVQSDCESEQSDMSIAAELRTALVPLYHETFSLQVHNPEGWERYKRLFDADMLALEDLGAQQTVTGSTAGWVFDGDVSGHQYVTLEHDDSYYWFISPAVELPATGSLDENEKLWLTFEVALTEYNSFNPISGTEPNDDDRFLVVISEDAGKTWRKSNATVWDNAVQGIHVLNDIPARFDRNQIDLTPYAGKVIKVAFYAESTVENARYDLHVDDVRVNRYVEENQPDAVCEGYDYEGYGFYLPYDDLQPGTTTYNRMVFSNSSNVADSIINLELTVSPMKRYEIPATTCEGEPYEAYDFVVAEGAQGEYKRKLQSASGCDSVAILKLSITPTIRVQMFDTICQGGHYQFGGMELRRTGVYADTIQSAVTLCDSITTLYLTVNEALRSTEEKVICFGETFDFNGTLLSETGTYVDTLSAGGCDSIVTLNLLVREEIMPTRIYGYVCPEETYTGNGFVGVPAQNGEYELPLHSIWGNCDSLVVLDLTVLDDDTVYCKKQIETADLPFTYHGTLYDESTEEGVYTQSSIVMSESGQCTAVLVATLQVGESSALMQTFDDQLTIMPNFIPCGGKVRVSAPVSELGIRVYDMSGRLVYERDRQALPFELDVFEVSGVYTIKACDAQGNIKYGRVVVK